MNQPFKNLDKKVQDMIQVKNLLKLVKVNVEASSRQSKISPDKKSATFYGLPEKSKTMTN